MVRDDRDDTADVGQGFAIGDVDDPVVVRDPRDDELFATLTALYGYYFARADLDRAIHVLELLRASGVQGRQWYQPLSEVMFGTVAWLRG